jgi:hypothetical protein
LIALVVVVTVPITLRALIGYQSLGYAVASIAAAVGWGNRPIPIEGVRSVGRSEDVGRRCA